MQRINLSQQEKDVLRHLTLSDKQPRNLSPIVYEYTLATLQEKGLIHFIADYGEITNIQLTLKGKAYLEQNPKLTNPIDWYHIISITMLCLTALSSTLALFVACTHT